MFQVHCCFASGPGLKISAWFLCALLDFDLDVMGWGRQLPSILGNDSMDLIIFPTLYISRYY